MTDRPEDSEDWPLRDWSTRIRAPGSPPPPGGEPSAATEPEILYEDSPELEDEEEARAEEDVAEAAEVAEREDLVPVEAPEEPEEPEEGPEEPEEEPEEPEEPEEEEPEAEPAPADEHAEGDFRIPDGYAVLEGTPSGQRRSVAIVVSRFNGEVTNRLLDSALEALDEAGVAQEAVLVMPVPGAFELPLAAMALAKTRRYSCVIALGCVIRGETPHFDFVASEAASGLQLAGIETGVPVSFGVLTCETVEQAEARIDRGASAALTALEMADAFAQLRTTLAAARGQ
jgi:6,7-dimethyl-8-ribityllumazine synthase